MTVRQRLLNLDELAFIESAYALVLGRAADPKGVRDCFQRLHDGATKAEVLDELQGSDESRAYAAKRAGRVIEPAPARLASLLGIRGDTAFVERCYLELTGAPPTEAESAKALQVLGGGQPRRCLMQALRGSAAGRAHRAALEDVHVLDLTADELLDSSRCTLDRLLSMSDEAFVQMAYRRLMGRDPDRTGRDFYLATLRLGTPRVQILHRLSESPEGRARGVRIEGLPQRSALGSWLAALFYGATGKLASLFEARSRPRRADRHDHA